MKRVRWWLALLRSVRGANTVVVLSVGSTMENLTWHPIDGFTGGSLTNAQILMVPGDAL